VVEVSLDNIWFVTDYMLDIPGSLDMSNEVR